MEESGCKSKTRDETVDIVKGIAICLVIVGHLIQYTLMAEGRNFFENKLFEIIYTFHMPLFMFVSGYLIYFSIKKRTLYKILGLKIRSLVIPYLVWTTLDFIMSIMVLMIKNKKFSLFEAFEKLMDMFLLMPNIWFLFTLFILSSIILAAVGLEKKMGIKVHIIIIMMILLIPTNSYFDWYFIKWFYLFFAAGYFANRYRTTLFNILKYKFSRSIISIILIFIYFTGLAYWSQNDYIYNNKFEVLSNEYFKESIQIVYRYMMGFLGIIITFILAEFINSKSTNIRRILSYLGKYTLDIFLLQRYVIEKMYAVIAAHISGSLVLFIPITAFVSLIICIIISNKLFRGNSKLNELFLGNRI